MATAEEYAIAHRVLWELRDDIIGSVTDSNLFRPHHLESAASELQEAIHIQRIAMICEERSDDIHAAPEDS